MTTLRRTVLTTVVLLATTLGATSSASAITKTFAVEVSPSTADAATSIVYTAKITNTITPQKQTLGSVDLTVPDNWRVLDAGPHKVVGQVVQVRGLGLAPGRSVDVPMRLDTSGVSGTWEFAARGKHANDFNGEGNDFTLDPRSSLTTDVRTTSAHDVHCPDEPVSVGKNTRCRTRVTWRGYGPLNDDGTPVPNDGAFPPAGATSRDEAVNALGVSQTLFSVTVDVVAIPSIAQNGGDLTLRVPAEDINCIGNSETSPVTALIDGPGNRAKTVTFFVDAAVDLAFPSQGMCFAGPVPFAPSTTSPIVTPILYGGSVFFQGTLPDCGPALAGVSPCTSLRDNPGKNNLTVVEMPFSYPDPPYRG